MQREEIRNQLFLSQIGQKFLNRKFNSLDKVQGKARQTRKLPRNVTKLSLFTISVEFV